MARKSKRPILVITPGDPGGIGPEITAKALAGGKMPARVRPLVVGRASVLERAAAECGLALAPRKVAGVEDAAFEPGAPDVVEPEGGPPGPFAVGRPTAEGGELAWLQIVEAVKIVRAAPGRALVTGPISKEALHMAGHRWPGHTEILAHLAGGADVVMMLAAGRLRASFVTWHTSYLDAPALITTERIVLTARLTREALVKMGVERARIAVAGLNPHAGEAGAFGREEIETIAPAVERLRAEGIDTTGPYPPDTVFRRARLGEFDCVVSMVHDHGHVALKMVAFEKGVNVTLGLPFVRTSVDHGTAYDIAGSGRADPSSLLAAARLAVKLLD